MGERVRVRPVGRGDAERLVDLNRESRAHHRPWVEPFTTADGFAAWFDAVSGEDAAGLVAEEVATGSVAGVLTISRIARGNFCSAYLGFYGMHAASGRGLMTDALLLTVRHGFDVLGLHRLEANVQPGNHRSIALLRRAGFRQEGFSPRYLRIGGEWRDHERWAVLADEAVGGPDPGALPLDPAKGGPLEPIR